MADIHGLKYNGENYSKEYDELLALLEEYGEENDGHRLGKIIPR